MSAVIDRLYRPSSGQVRDDLAQNSGLMTPAIEEMLRYESPIQRGWRRVAKDVTVRGRQIRAGELVFQMFGAANRDSAQFADPDRFDIRRDASKSIAFGAGPHFCAGAWASRAMIADVALPVIFARLKNLRIDDGTPVRIGGWAFRGLLNLPLTWDQ